jgi:hypothetical protein
MYGVGGKKPEAMNREVIAGRNHFETDARLGYRCTPKGSTGIAVRGSVLTSVDVPSYTSYLRV